MSVGSSRHAPPRRLRPLPASALAELRRVAEACLALDHESESDEIDRIEAEYALAVRADRVLALLNEIEAWRDAAHGGLPPTG